MPDYIQLKRSNCKNCYRCIRNCPVKSIRFSDNQAHILPDECILCGRCFTACPQNAKEIRDDVSAVEALLREGDPVIASVAPSFIAHMPGLGALTRALTALGFTSVEETAIGATIVKRAFEAEAQTREVTISSCCPTVNLLIQRHYPDALPYLSHTLSPMQAHGLDIQRRIPRARVVFIGPCISKKAEVEQYPGPVAAALTFEELFGWLERRGVTITQDADAPEEASRARLFPTAGGILATMDPTPGVAYLAADGIEDCIAVIEDVLTGQARRCFIELSACAGSCIGGPAMPREWRCRPVADALAVRRYAGPEDFPAAAYDARQLKKSFAWAAPRHTMPGESAIAAVLRKIGKTKPEHELNCGGCGYSTCREKARAVIEGKADLNMCLPYLHERASSFSDTIIQNTPNAIFVLNESLEIQQINRAACALMSIRDPEDVLGSPVVRILDPSPFLAVTEGVHRSESRTYLPEYNKHVHRTVIFDPNYRIVICIMRDVTETMRQREAKEALGRTTIATADKVIEKQMRAVQEIASLLGETAAETKVALTQLKESLRDG